ncbi:unnamed protein product [Brachionus calyciflorus]|uniref:Fas-binding factor 1 C-terminal domain-containing protein n=1 Tax=Brachionus calyciflorus TaxID=104777 RepID=A0A813PW17_9BILA|nr:unnamed protein product [Brachionus calyciflorus]
MSRFNHKFNSSFNDSDISDADGDDIAKILRDTEDLDGGIKKNMTKPNLSQTMPSALNKSNSIIQRNKSFNFEDDPLDNLDELIGKKHLVQNTSSKPPLASTMPAPAKNNKIGFIFDDDIQDSKPKPSTQINQTSKQIDNTSKQKSLVDELFGKPKQEKSNTDFKLDDKYVKMSQEAIKSEDENFVFGSYMPSVALTTPRAGPPKRSVSFNDDLNDDDFMNKPKMDSSNLNKTVPANKLDLDFDFESLLKPKSQSKPVQNNKNDEWLKEPPKLETSFDLDASFSNQKRRGSIADKPPINFKSTKDSMNSSFADSIENMEQNTTTTNNNKNLGLANMQPLGFEVKTIEDNKEQNWFNNLVTNRKTTTSQIVPKKQNSTNISFNETNSTDFLLVDDQTALTDKIEQSFINKSSKLKFNNNSVDSLNMSTKKSSNLFMNVENVVVDKSDSNGLIQRIKQLEYENQDLKLQLEHTKTNSDLQIQLIKDSCDNQVKMLKQDRENGLKLFKEEKEILQNHIDLIEKEKLDLSNVYKLKLDDKQKEFDMEIDKLKQLHKVALANLKEEHEEFVNRIKRLKENEISAAIAANSHTRTLENVISLIEDNTKNLDSISHKVQMDHMVNMNEHDLQIRNKEEKLRLQEERLSRQQKDYETEIRNLNETIQRLENHLAEQSKNVAEERWKTKQQEKKMEAFQEALINEQKIIMEKLARERNDIDRSKDEILLEQKRLMQQIYEEKRKIAEDRANLEASLNAYKDKQHKDSLSNINIEAEISVSTKRLNDEKERLEKLRIDLREKELEIQQEKKSLEEKKHEMNIKNNKLDQLQAVLNSKYSDAEELYMKSNRERESNQKILNQINEIKMNHDSRLNQIQQQLLVLNERETQINQEKIALYKLQQDIELYKSNLTCSKCKEPVKDLSILAMSMQSSGYGTAFVNNSQLEDSKLLRQLKVQALKDKQFINDERQFIEQLKNNNRSYSMNQLNSTLA